MAPSSSATRTCFNGVPLLVQSINKSRRFYFQFPAPRWEREAPQGWNAPRIFELNEAEIFRRKRGKIRHVVQIVDMSEGMRVVRRIDIG